MTARVPPAALPAPRAGQTQAAAGPELAYLVAEQQGLPLAVVCREIAQLRAEGWAVAVMLATSPGERQLAAWRPGEQAVAATACRLEAGGWRAALAAHGWGWRRPWAYLRAPARALAGNGGCRPGWRQAGQHFSAALRLARWLAAQGRPHLHLHFSAAVAAIVPLARMLTPFSLSLSVHGDDAAGRSAGATRLLAAADFYVCSGRLARGQLMQAFPAADWGRFEFCPPGVGSVPIVGGERSRRHRDRFTICSSGALTPERGLPVLLEACAALRDWGRDVRLLLLGSGPEEAALRGHCKALGLEQQVEFRVAPDYSMLCASYRASHVFVLPSFSETLPLSLLDAMAAGLPGVASRVGAIPEMIRDGVDGLLVNPADVQELADALAQLMDDPELRQELAVAGRLRIVADYDLATNVSRLGQIFRMRLGGLGRSG